MASNPDELASRHHKAELVALALLARSRRRYSLPGLIRQNGVNPKPFRRISPTEALRSSIAASHLSIAQAWQAQRSEIEAAYTRARLTGDTATAQRRLEAIAASILPLVARVQGRFPAVFADIEAWHRAQWLARIRAATSLDVSLLTGPQDVAQETANAATWNQQLAADVHRQLHQGISAAMLAGFAVGATPVAVRTRVNGLLAKSRQRAARIGVDQADKAVGAMDRGRREAAGLSRFRWHHFDPQPHPRPEHVGRQGRIYSEANAPNDRAGTLPFCKCWEELLWG